MNRRIAKLIGGTYKKSGVTFHTPGKLKRWYYGSKVDNSIRGTWMYVKFLIGRMLNLK